MQLSEMNFPNGLPVDGYGPGFFRIGGERHDGGLIVAPNVVQQWGGFSDFGPIKAMQGRIDVLFLGMGADMAMPPTDFRESVEALHIGLEVMNSPTACRTYNVVLSEGRRIALAVLPV